MSSFIFAFILIVITSFIQGSYAVSFSGIFAMSVCLLCANMTPKTGRKRAVNLVGILFCVYWVSATIISASFENGQFFYVKDPSAYYSTYLSIHSIHEKGLLLNLYDLYLTLKDNNALYNTIMYWLAFKGNVSWGGANMMYYTVFHLMFGVLSSIAIFRIFCNIENSTHAYKHTLFFCLVSLFHLYSCLCVRDIWIAAAFLWGVVIVLKPHSMRGLLALIILFLFTAGMRIYSGLFFSVFIAYYLLKMARNTKFKALIYLFIGILGLVVITSAVASILMEQTLTEVNDVYEEQMERGASGLSTMIYNLPHGMREIVMVFYSQIMPFPSFMFYSDAATFSHFYISTFVLVFPLVNFVSFYGLLYLFVTKKKYKLLNFDDWALIVIAVLLAVANSSQMDIRRIMPSFVIFYYCYCKLFILDPRLCPKKTNRTMAFWYMGLLLVYVVLKYR